MLGPKQLCVGQNFRSLKIRVNKVWVQKNVGPKYIWVQFWVQKKFGSKKCSVKTTSWSSSFLGPTYVGSIKIMSDNKFVQVQQIVCPKKLGPIKTKLWVNKFGVEKRITLYPHYGSLCFLYLWITLYPVTLSHPVYCNYPLQFIAVSCGHGSPCILRLWIALYFLPYIQVGLLQKVLEVLVTTLFERNKKEVK